MPPAYVKPYVKRGKTDGEADRVAPVGLRKLANEAEAICEAVTRPTMRFVAVKSREQQGVLMLHKTRDLLVRQRTALIHALRAHLAEFGVVAATGPGGVKVLTKLLHEARDELPVHARTALTSLVAKLDGLAAEIEQFGRQGALRRYQQAGRRISPTSSRCRRDRCRADGATRPTPPAMACQPRRAKDRPCRDGGPREQDGTDRLGGHDTEGGLRGLNGIPSAGPPGAGMVEGAEW